MAQTATSNGRQSRALPWIWVILTACLAHPIAQSAPTKAQRVFEATFESKKSYADPFNDVDIDVVFTDGHQSWRVPAFWRGGNRWSVRFAPPAAGEYVYHLESTDRSNADLNGQEKRITITAYSGRNKLLKHGPLKVSANKRYFEHADGTPFYWMGDDLYGLLSGRLSWKDFQRLVADRKTKGFTVVEVAAGLSVSNEELAPIDAGFGNEGGQVWDPEYQRINPRYFDFADRRINHLIDSEIVPAIFGAWGRELKTMGVPKLQKHWRYIIARYGAYPVFWILGGEVHDPQVKKASDSALLFGEKAPKDAGWWTQMARYVRTTDPYRHPLTVHEHPPPNDIPLQDETLTDFDLTQPSHLGWASIAMEVAQLNTRGSATGLTKPIVVGEIGCEGFGGEHLSDFQRTAFWLAMLNGAAGYSYIACETSMVTGPNKPLHSVLYSFFSWEEAMNFPGSYQSSLGANLLKTYPWWQMAPHPEWVIPRGTTLLEPHEGRYDVDLGKPDPFFRDDADTVLPAGRWNFPKGKWLENGGNFLLPYAAGVPGKLRIVYIPYYGILNFIGTKPPTILALEDGISYHAYYWEPSLGIKVDLGLVEKPAPGALLRADRFEAASETSWRTPGSGRLRFDGSLTMSGASTALLKDVAEADAVAAVDVRSDADATLLLRYQDADNYLAAVYSAGEKSLYLAERKQGKDGPARMRTPVAAKGSVVRLTIEARDNVAAAAIVDGDRTYATAIENVAAPVRGAVGLMLTGSGATQSFASFELRASPTLVKDERLEKKLYDAKGNYRGELSGHALPNFPPDWPTGWDDFGKRKRILLSAFRPERLPTTGDWVLVLENRELLDKESQDQLR